MRHRNRDAIAGRFGLSAALTLFLASFAVLPFAADLAAQVVAEDGDWRFRRLAVADGLAQSTVLSLHQDQLGFLWIGTENGAQRYDGRHFLDFSPEIPGSEGLRHSRVEGLFEDRSGALWIGSLGGLDRLDTAATDWLPLEQGILAATDGERLDLFAEDRDGRLWLAGDGFGIGILSPTRDHLSRLRHRDGALPSDRVRCLVVDAEGPGGEQGLWIGFADAPPIFLGGSDDSTFRPRSIEGLPSRDIRHIVVDGGAVWFATAAGLARLDKAALAPGRSAKSILVESHDPANPRSLAADDLQALVIDRAGRLWTGGPGGLSLRLGDGEFRHFRHDPADVQSLSHDHVTTLLEDQGGLIWVGAELGGVTVIDPRPRLPAVTQNLPAKVVRAVGQDPRGRLWIGTDGGGICRREGELCLGPPPGSPLAQARRAWALLPDRDDHIWLGTPSGLFRFAAADLSQATVFTHDADRPSSLGPGGVRALDLDESGRLWVALWGGGLSRLDPGEQRFEHFRAHREKPFSLPSDLTLTLFRDRRSHLWIGTAAGLARRTADARFHSYHHDPLDASSLLGDVVRAIHQDQAGDLWVGTDAGLNRLPADLVASPPVAAPNNRGFTHYTEIDGLMDNTVNAIEEDLEGRLWLATNRGLTRFDPRAETFTHFDLQDGLPSLELLAGASFAGADGHLYFGSLGGYNIFSPGQIQINEHAPPVRITSVRRLQDDQPVDIGDTLILRSSEDAVAIELAALDFSQPETNRFAYRLDDRETEWRQLGSRSTLILSGLEAGEYALRLRAANGDGVWGEASAPLRLRVKPASWLSGWAFSLYALALCVLLGLLAWGQRKRTALDRRVDDVTRLNENRLQLALDGSGDGLWDWNLQSGEVYRSGIAEMLGFESSELPNDATWRHRWIHPDDRDRVEAEIQEHLRGESRRFEAEYRVRDASGAWRWILDRGNIVERREDDSPLRMAGTFKDLTRHKETERELRLWSTVFEAIDEGVMVLGRDGRVRAVNDAFCLLFGRPRHGLLGRPIERLRSQVHPDAFFRRIRRELLVHGRWNGELRHPRPDGTERLVWAEMRAVAEPTLPSPDKGSRKSVYRHSTSQAAHARPNHFVVVVSDITRRKRVEEELRYLADYDPLTDLPNRAMFAREAQNAFERAKAEDRRIALIFADLDQFKQINDTLGHAAGDQVLQEAARRLLTSVRTDDLVARLSGDELVVLLHNPNGQGSIDRESVTLVARRILGAFTPSFKLENHDLSVSASLGIALHPEDGETIETLIENADSAMYGAKAEGRNRFSFYRRELATRATDRLTLDRRLRRALDQDALELHYQPIFDLARSEVVAAEALLRWPQPDGEIWSPARFLDVAEATGLIVPLGTWVLEAACRQAAAWHQAGRRLGLSVNLSSQQLDRDDLTQLVEAALLASGLPASQLCLEITEDAVVERGESRLAQAEQLGQLGIRLSIDDFGTGFSSLPQLQRLPFDELKIDRTFVDDIEGEGAAIARTILAMAEGMEVDVVAEGVETEAQLETLTELGCARAQGHLIGHPLPPDELEALMSSTEAPWRRLAAARRRRVRGTGSGQLRQVD